MGKAMVLWPPFLRLWFPWPCIYVFPFIMYKKPVIGTKLILYENLIFNIGSINQLGIFEYNFLQILMVKIRKSKLILEINL